MKRIIFAICTILCANVLFAQEQLATLKHNGNISVYYGANAFVEAYNAAENGDIITLSDGTFNATTISKEILRVPVRKFARDRALSALIAATAFRSMQGI